MKQFIFRSAFDQAEIDLFLFKKFFDLFGIEDGQQYFYI